MLRIANLTMPLFPESRPSLLPLCPEEEAYLRRQITRKCGLRGGDLLSLTLFRRSVDARKKEDVHFVVTVDFSVRDEASVLKRCRFLTRIAPPAPMKLSSPAFQHPPLIVGAGPAGLFAALTLAKAGASPLLIERGRPVDLRAHDVLALERQGLLLPESNVQFGEGGAGAFSDGKLTTGVKSPYLRTVLETFVAHGAPESILTDQKPHIGSDNLGAVVTSLRREIIALGGSVCFETRLDRLLISHGRVVGALVVQNGETREIPAGAVLLCIGHSARDTVHALFDQGVRMVQKPFALGARVEHPRIWIDQAQYGRFAGHPALGAATYKLVCHTPDGRGVYTFCMCPGGRVIAAASEPGGVVTNGMSLYARNGQNSNAALLVGIRTQDFGSDHPLAGLKLQRAIEEKAFRLAGENYHAPAQRVEDFLAGRATRSFGEVIPSYLPGVSPADLAAVLPPFAVENLRLGLRAMDRDLKGFAHPDAVLTGPETRSSSPVRLLRTDSGEAENLPGLYPVGEGAGYAGGIVSAAIDGISSAVLAMENAI